MLDENDRPLGEVKFQQVKETAEIGDLLDFSPYHDDPEQHATENGKQPPSIPQDDDSNIPTKRTSSIYNVVVSVVTVTICLVIIFIVLSKTGFFRELREERREQLQTAPPISSPSRNFALNFPEQYPPLDVKQSSEECRTAWQTLTEIPCHDSIWTRNWDNGLTSFLGPSLDQFVPLICDSRCAPALEEARKTVQSACSKEDAFHVNGYKGRYNVELLESGPADVLDLLVARQTHMCRTSPTGDAERGFCMTDLNSRWGMVDGIRVNGTQTLRWFLDGTNNRKEEPAGMHRGMQGSGGWSENYSYWREERKFGPGRGETTCSWCTLNWLKRSLPLWEHDMVDWDGSTPTLPQYLRIWENAGKRCAGDDFMEAYRAAVQEYIDRGLLEADWDIKPSGDIPYLMQHGPTAGDFPAKDLDLAILKLEDYRDNTANINPTLPSRIKHQADVTQYIGCLESFKVTVQDLECYPFLSKDEISEFVLSDMDAAQRSCSANCLDSVGIFQTTMYRSCKPAFLARVHPQMRRFLGEEVASFVEHFFQPKGTISMFEATCRSASSRPLRGPPCAAIFKQWGKQDWVFQDSRPEMKDLITTTRNLLVDLPEIPSELKDWKHPGRKLTTEEEKLGKEFDAWRKTMERGVCSDCMWRNFVEGTSWMFDSPEDIAIEGIKTAHQLREECAARKKIFQENELTRVDEMWKKSYGEEAWNQAFKENQVHMPSAVGHDELV